VLLWGNNSIYVQALILIFDLLHKIIACRFSNILDWLYFDIKQIPNAFVIIGAATKIMRNFALPHFHAKLEKLNSGSLKLISDNKTLRKLYHGYIMVISWLYHGYIMVISCLYHGYILVISWLYHGWKTKETKVVRKNFRF